MLWGTMEAIDQVLTIEFPLTDVARLEAISEGFSRYCHGRIKGCVMAMDGWVCSLLDHHMHVTIAELRF